MKSKEAVRREFLNRVGGEMIDAVELEDWYTFWRLLSDVSKPSDTLIQQRVEEERKRLFSELNDFVRTTESLLLVKRFKRTYMNKNK